MAFKTSDNGVNFLKSQEGCRLTAYKLSGETYWTIGYGHYGADVYEGMTITAAQAEELLRQDLVRFENGVNEIAVSKFPSINQNQFDALVSYSYNRGLGNTAGTNGLRQLIYNSDTLAEVSTNFVIYWGSAETYKDALIQRRKREQTLFNTPVSESAKFPKRLSATSPTNIEGSRYYYSENPLYQRGYGMPNCTCYALGRFWEIADVSGDGSNKPPFAARSEYSGQWNAGNWADNIEKMYKEYFVQRQPIPQEGAIICWKKPGQAGHVAVVESVDKETGDIVTSNSAWQSTFFYTKIIYKSDGYNFGNYVFQGFIYNPNVGAGVNPADYPSIITEVKQLSATEVSVTGKMNGVEGVTSHTRCVYKWGGMDDTNQYEFTGVGDFSVTISKPRDATSIEITPIQVTNSGTEISGTPFVQNLYPSYPCINISVSGIIRDAVPYIFTGGEWRPTIPIIKTGGNLYKVYNTDKEKI